ncbi:MAG: putative ABC transport system permease protein [Myxococcota bacterium]|jgi:putative ABC transport system permease protein
MDTILRLALRNALRNARRSTLTAVTVLLGCALLTIGLAWVLGIQGNFIDASVRANGHVRLVSDAYDKRERIQPLYENLPQTDALIERLSQVEGVRTVYPRIQVGVLASVGNEIGEVYGQIIGAPLPYFETILDLKPRVIDGTWFSAEPDNEALIGQALANTMGVVAGDEAIFIGQTQDGSPSPIKVTVVGVVDTGNGLFDKQVFVPLEKARWLTDIPEGAIELLLFGDNPPDARHIMARLTPQLDEIARDAGLTDIEGQPAGFAMSSWNTREPFASLLLFARIIMGAIAAIIVFITALGVLNTMLMSVLERTAEIGVLRAMGMKVHAVVLMFVLEALAISSIGGLLGAILGSGVALLMERYGVDLGSTASDLPDTIPANSTLYPDWSPEIALVAFGLGLVMAFIGSASPALRAARIQPVTAMRARR